MNRVILSIFTGVLLLASSISLLRAEEAALFADTTLLKLELHLDYRELCKNKERKNCTDATATIVYDQPDGLQKGTEQRMQVKLRPRGRWRSGECHLPALFVLIEPEQAAGTLFEGQSVLPMTTHCSRSKSYKYQQYVLVEYLAYRLYQLLTENSLRVRLLEVDYVNVGSGRRARHYAFFSEHFEDLAVRTDQSNYRTERINLRETNPMDMEILALFQFMISNLDWSAVYSHNTAQFSNAQGLNTSVPFDFDYAGMVNAEYALLPKMFDHLHSLHVRRYRGFCWPDFDWSALFDKFIGLREQMFAELAAVPGLSRTTRRFVRGYLKSFYRIIESEEKRRKQIIERCRPMVVRKN